MKSIKLQIVALAVLLGFATTTVVTPRPAQAIIGIAVASYALRTAGGITMLLGGAGVGAGAIYAAYTGTAFVIGGTTALGVGTLIATVTAGIGLILLDEKSGSLAFQTIDVANTATYANAGVTADQVAVYNTEIDELNAARETIDSEMVRTNGSMEDAKVLWESYRSHFSPETITVASKLMNEAFKNMQR